MAGDSLITTRWVELGLAAFTAGLGGIVMVGSLEQGIGWGDAGPEPGYFPFYIGLLLTLASLATALQSLWRWQALRTSFVERAAFGQVLRVFLPMLAFVVALPLLGLYLTAFLFIAWFMARDRQRQRRYGVWQILATAGGVSLASYLIFALWFKVPLDAGPLADLARLLRSLS